MIETINFKGAVRLAPKVEKTIREKEVFSLMKTFKELPEDVFVKNREILNAKGRIIQTFFDCFTEKTQKSLPQVVTYEK